MGVKQKLLIVTGLILFLIVPFLIFQYFNLNAIAHDAQRCSEDRADYIKSSRFSHTSNFGTESQYCQELENEAWGCRFAAIMFVVLGGYCFYAAFKGKKS